MDEISALPFGQLFKHFREQTQPTSEELDCREPHGRSHTFTRKLTQSELAGRSGYSVDLIRKIEGGKQVPPKRTIEIFADAMRLSAEERNMLLLAAERERRARKQPQPLALVGRKRELQAIERYLKGDGPPLLLFMGESGIGKSRLLHEVVNRARIAGWTVIKGGCYRQIGQEPYTPISDALSELLQPPLPKQYQEALRGCEWLSRLLPTLTTMGIVLEPSTTVAPEQERRLLFEAVKLLLTNIAGASGTLVVLDDLQWAGADAIDLLVNIVRTSAPKPIRIVGAFRDGEVTRQNPLRLLIADLVREQLARVETVETLAHPEAEAIVQALLNTYQHPSREDYIAKILLLAEGIPFIVENLARSLGAGTWDPASTGIKTLPHVADVLYQQIIVLPPLAQKLLRIAAVIGRNVPTKLLIAVAVQCSMSEDEIAEAAEQLCYAKLLIDRKNEYHFTHDLIRDVVMMHIGGSRQLLLHQMIAEALERQPGEKPIEQIAYHYVEAEELGKAVVYLERAGFRAQTMLATAQAISYYRSWAEGLVKLARLDEAAQAYQQISDLFMMMGQYEEAKTALQSGILTAPRDDRFLHVRFQLKMANIILGGQYHYNQSHYAEALQFTEAAVTEAEACLGEEPPEEHTAWWQTWLDIKLSQLSWYYGLSLSEKMLVIAAQVQPVVTRYGTLLQQSNFHYRYSLTLFLGNGCRVTEESLNHKRAALAGYEALGISSSIAEMRFGLGFHLLWYSDLDEAERYFQEAYEMAIQQQYIDIQ